MHLLWNYYHLLRIMIKIFVINIEWKYFITSIPTTNKCCNISEVSLHRYTSDIDQFPFWPKCQKCGISSSRCIIGLD